jgi:hypothetical protein
MKPQLPPHPLAIAAASLSSRALMLAAAARVCPHERRTNVVYLGSLPRAVHCPDCGAIALETLPGSAEPAWIAPLLTREFGKLRELGKLRNPSHDGDGDPLAPIPLPIPPTREFPIAFASQPVKPGEMAQVEAAPLYIFRGDRLVLARSSSLIFDVVDIDVVPYDSHSARGETPEHAHARFLSDLQASPRPFPGYARSFAQTLEGSPLPDAGLPRSQGVDIGALPGECLGPDAVNVRMQIETAWPGDRIRLTVKNNAGIAESFRALYYGTMVQ